MRRVIHILRTSIRSKALAKTATFIIEHQTDTTMRTYALTLNLCLCFNLSLRQCIQFVRRADFRRGVGADNQAAHQHRHLGHRWITSPNKYAGQYFEGKSEPLLPTCYFEALDEVVVGAPENSERVQQITIVFITFPADVNFAGARIEKKGSVAMDENQKRQK